MDARTKTKITLTILIVMIIGIYFLSDWFSKTVGYVIGPNENTSLASCLNEKESSFYFSDNCPECERQLRAFGESAYMHLDKKIKCDNEVGSCEYLDHVPAWIIMGEIHYGFKSLDELAYLAQC